MHDPEHQSLSPGSVAAILPAAGSGHRFAAEQNKLFALLAGKPLWHHAIERLASRPEIGRLILPISDADRERFLEQREASRYRERIEFCRGGAERSDSVAAALQAIGDDEAIRFVAVHDAARPLLGQSDLAAVLAMAQQTGAAILAAPVAGTVKRSLKDGTSSQTIDRRELYIALTPQVFHIDLIRVAYARHRGFPVTDDAQMIERQGHPVTIVPGSADNLKITYPEDLLIAEAILHRNDVSRNLPG